MSYDKEIFKYEVVIQDYVSAIGAYRHFETKEFETDDDAIAYAREKMKNPNFRIAVRVIENIIGWWV